MSTTFAAFVSTGLTLVYSCVRLCTFFPYQQVSQTAWLFESNHGGTWKTMDSLDFSSTDVQCSGMVLKLFLRQGWYVRTQGVLLHLCFCLYGSKLLLEMLWALLQVLLIILCLLPLLFKIILSWPNVFFQRFVGGANTPDSKRLTALSHMGRMTAARQSVLIGVGRVGA